MGGDDQLVEGGGPLLVTGPLEPGAEEAVIVVAGDEDHLAARERIADRLEEGAGAGQRLAERTIAELDRVAEQDQAVRLDRGERLEQSLPHRRAPQHVAAGLGAEVQVGDQDRGRHAQQSSQLVGAGRPITGND